MSPIPERLGRPNGSFYINAEWTLRRIIWPQRCEITGRKLWPGTQAYRGRVVWHDGPGTPVVECKWHARQEHLMWQLKE
jgi:hypothetical protein